MPDPDYKALCAELLADYEQNRFRVELAAEARAALAQPEPVAPTDEDLLANAFAIVQKRLEQLAGDQQLMIYCWPEAGEWDIHHTNPTSSVQLGEVSGVYGSTGRILEDVVFALAAQLSANNTGGTH
jgi:hypothetical protein